MIKATLLPSLLAAPLLLLASPALAADGAPASPVLTVTAEGHSTHAPDLATFTAGVSSTGHTAGEALSANAEAMTRVIATLKAAGIEPRDIQTSNLSLNPVYNQRPYNQADNTPPRIVGYTATNNVSVRQRKLAAFGTVIDALVSAGATQVSGPNFELDNPDAALDEARVDAVTKARARAELYAKAAGLKVGRIIAINEGEQNNGPVAHPFALKVMAATPRAPTPVEAGEQEVTAQVTINFEMVP